MQRALFFLLAFHFSIANVSCNYKRGDNKLNSISAGKQHGKVIRIIDGDTYDILLAGNKSVRIRMQGIDAPEKGMPFYKAAKKHLSDLCFGKDIWLEIRETDRYGRKIAFSHLADGTELSQEMIKAGFAWHFKKYNNDFDLAELEVKARESKIGLWADKSPMPPWENRALHRNGASTKDSFNIKERQE